MIMCTDTGWVRRSGLGIVLGLVFLALAILTLMQIASAVQRSGTARAYRRVVDWHIAHEAGSAAIAEAVAYLRDSVDIGQVNERCPDDWRALMLAALAAPSQRPAGKIEPVKARALLTAEVASLAIGPVMVSTVALVVPPEYAQRRAPPLPQGIFEMSVKVEGTDGLLQVSRIVRQRRVFYATLDPGRSGRPVRDGAVTFTILRDPMGTVLE